MQHVQMLAHPRVGDSDVSRAAADYIRAHVPGTQDVRVGTVTLPGIEILGATFRKPREVTTTDPDLVVRFGPTTGKALLIMAHYDTVPGSPGAVDNAAAVATLIELAHALAAEPPKQPVLLAFTANEEIGLIGAEALVQQRGDEVGLAIALDLIGGSGDLSLNGASTLIGDAELSWLADAADRAGVVVRAPLPHRVVSRWWPQAERSDHGPFTRHGIRAFHLYNRGQDGELIDLAYHSKRDVFARVQRSSVDELGRLLRALASSPIPAHAGDGFWLPLAANTVVPRGALLAFEILLVAVALAGLALRDRPRAGRLAATLDALGLGGIVRWGPRIELEPPPQRRILGMLLAIAAFVAAVVTAHLAQTLISPAWISPPATLGTALVLAGAAGLFGGLARRTAPADLSRVFHAIAIALPLAIGLALLGLGAAELAWLWLIPAAGIALRLPLLALLPFLVLLPGQVREAVWNGFWPTAVPVTAWIAILGLPILAEAASIARRRTRGPLGALVLLVGCGLTMIAGVSLLFSAHPRCANCEINQFDLAAEVDR